MWENIQKLAMRINSGWGAIETYTNFTHFIYKTKDIEGEIVELGCYEGLTAIVIQNILDFYKINKQLHIYDSFCGLTNKSDYDGDYFKDGSMKLVLSDPVARINANFDKYKTKRPTTHKGYFADTLPAQLPEKISFAYLDGDFYQAIKESLIYTYPRLSVGGIVVIDDYHDEKVHGEMRELMNKNIFSMVSNRKLKLINYLPGVKKACDEFFSDKPEKISVLYSGENAQGYFEKL